MTQDDSALLRLQLEPKCNWKCNSIFTTFGKTLPKLNGFPCVTITKQEGEAWRTEIHGELLGVLGRCELSSMIC